jgi:hypothetical protein
VKFYREVLAALSGTDIRFLVGGAFAFCRHAGIDRRTKDLDLMVEEASWPRLARALRAQGIYTKRTFPHWLGKALSPEGQVDIIYNSGAALTPVDETWFENGVPASVLGFEVLLCPIEELIWSKSFIMERERFDGADVMHLIRAHAENIDWRRLRRRFEGHEAVLLAQLILFRYIYPSEASRLPAWIQRDLGEAAAADLTDEQVCRGTNLSRAQYLVDVEDWGYADARLPPYGTMSDRNWVIWTNAIDARQSRVRGGHRRSAPAKPMRLKAVV